jgi:nucleoside-diphosphate-sugar epimerase
VIKGIWNQPSEDTADPMSILVTGSAGHLGEALMRTLRAAGRPARGLDIKPSLFTDCVGSICDRDFIARCMDGVGAVIHAATLHKPHLVTHTYQDFLDTNVTGTLVLLEAATAARVQGVVFTSTTSAFGAALTPGADEPAAWITEDVVPVPRNVYGASKLAAERVCELFFRKAGLPVIVLRTSRFFPEADDDPTVRATYETANAQANELLHRRVDIEDVVGAHLLALEHADRIGFGRYIISATTPFAREDLSLLRRNAPDVVHRLFPDCPTLYASRNWSLFPYIDRVYVNRRARVELGWNPRYDFGHVLACLRAEKDFRSPLARDVGSKGYHATTFEEGPYPVA